MLDQLFLIVADSRDDHIPYLVRQLGISLRYSKLAAETFDLSSGDSLPTLSRYSSVLFLSPASGEFLQASLQDLQDYVQNGGSLTFLVPELTVELQQLLGVVIAAPCDSAPVVPKDPEEPVYFIHFTSDRIAGLEDTTVSLYDIYNWLPLTLTLADDVVIDAYIVSGDVREPAIWHRADGAGEIAVWTFLPRGRHWGRSFLLHHAIQGQPVAVKSVVNTAVFHIDDFPLPVASFQVPVEGSEILEWSQFLKNVWLPDMAALAKKHRMSYSFGVIFHYNRNTKAPFELGGWEIHPESGKEANAGTVAKLVRWARDHGELGLHGYNHIPLMLGEWPSRDAMVESLRACLSWWEGDATAESPTSYIPPMNVYDQDGALALSQACPSIRTICGNFWGPVSKGAGREFAFEQWNPELFCLPRVTSGCELDTRMKWSLLASMYELGVWTHYTHPDDILDVPADAPVTDFCRNPESKPWRGPCGLLRETDQILEFVRRVFPSLTFDTATDATTKIIEHLNNDFHCRFSEQRVILDSDRPSHVVVSARAPNREIAGIDNAAELLNIRRTPERTDFTIRITPGRTIVRFAH